MINKSKVAKHFDLTITDTSLTWRRNEAAIRKEAQLDGVYVVRTSLSSS